jgi:hypothetical protein
LTDGTARYLTERAMAELEQVRVRLRRSVLDETSALSAALVRQLPDVGVTLNGRAAPPASWTGRMLTLHVFVKRTRDSLLLLSHTMLDQTARQDEDGPPFGWTCSLRQELHGADLAVLRAREIAVTYSGALGDEPLPVKLSEAAQEFAAALEAGRFAIGVSGLVQEMAAAARPLLPQKPEHRSGRAGRGR